MRLDISKIIDESRCILGRFEYTRATYSCQYFSKIMKFHDILRLNNNFLN